MKRLLSLMLLTAVIAFTVPASYAQTKPTNYKFYATYEDLINNKPLAGYDLEPNSWKMIMNRETFEVKNGGKSDKMKMSELPAQYIVYGNDPMRVNDGHCYIILVEGAHCFYAQYQANGIQMTSETITGEMVDFKEKHLEKLVELNGMEDRYKRDKPKREMKDSVNDWFNKVVGRYIKYYKLINEKEAKKK